MFKPNWFSCALTLLGIFAAVSWHYEWHDLTIGSLGVIGGMFFALYLYLIMVEKPVILYYAKLRGIPPGSEFVHKVTNYRLLDDPFFPFTSDLEEDVRPSFHLRVGNLRTLDVEFFHGDTMVVALTPGAEWPTTCDCPRCVETGERDDNCPLCKGEGRYRSPDRILPLSTS